MFKDPKVSPKIVSLVFSILVLCFAVGFYIFAQWQEPDQPPPGGEFPVPLHTGAEGQSKIGGLMINTGGAATGFIVDKGKVGIGTRSPETKLDVVGTVKMTGFKMPTGAGAGKVLTSDASGVGTWQTVSAEDDDWTGAGTGTMYATYVGDKIAIGSTTASPNYKLKVFGGNYGGGIFSGSTGLVGKGGHYGVVAFGTNSRGMALLAKNTITNSQVDLAEGSLGIDVYKGGVRIRDLRNCTRSRTLDTDAQGNLICGTDEAGAGGQGLPGPPGPPGPQGDPGINPGTYSCPSGQVMKGFTVAPGGSVTLECVAGAGPGPGPGGEWQLYGECNLSCGSQGSWYDNKTFDCGSTVTYTFKYDGCRYISTFKAPVSTDNKVTFVYGFPEGVVNVRPCDSVAGSMDPLGQSCTGVHKYCVGYETANFCLGDHGQCGNQWRGGPQGIVEWQGTCFQHNVYSLTKYKMYECR